jgi:hypothetical protein
MFTEFDESEPVNAVINATLTVVAVTPGALALFPAAPPDDGDEPPEVAPLPVPPAVAVDGDVLLDELPHAAATNPTTTKSVATRQARRAEGCSKDKIPPRTMFILVELEPS